MRPAQVALETGTTPQHCPSPHVLSSNGPSGQPRRTHRQCSAQGEGERKGEGEGEGRGRGRGKGNSSTV